MKLNKKTKVLVTGVGGVSTGHQIVQSLQMHPELYELGGTDITPYSYGLFKVKNRYVVPSASDKAYISIILNILKQNKYDILIPGSEIELFPLAENLNKIQKIGVRTLINPLSVIKTYLNKLAMSHLLSEKGFLTPHTSQLKNWKSFLHKFDFPIVIKPIIKSGGSRDVKILFTYKDLRNILELVKVEDFILQEYIKSDQEYTVGVLVSPEGKIIDSIALCRILEGLSLKEKVLKKNSSYCISSGITQGFIVRDMEVQSCCEQLALQIGVRGPLNVQCRKTKNGISIFEVHPRFSGSAHIRSLAGFNEADILIRCFLYGESFGRIPYRSDLVCIRGLHELVLEKSQINELVPSCVTLP